MSHRFVIACLAAPLWLAAPLAAQGKPAPQSRPLSKPSVSGKFDTWLDADGMRLRDLGALDGMFDTLGDLGERLTLSFNEGFDSNFNLDFGDELGFRLKNKLDRVWTDRLGEKLYEKSWDNAWDKSWEKLDKSLDKVWDRDADGIYDRIDVDRLKDKLTDRLNDVRRDLRPLADAPTFRMVPPEPFAQGDSADSLYRSARETLSRGDYRRAARLFRDIGDKFPKSAYASDALYWQAFALYRIGSDEELKEGLAALDAQKTRFPQAATNATDAGALAARIRGALAARGNRVAATRIERDAAQTGASCDKEDQAVRIEALSALGQMDPAATMPILRRVLARRDECSGSLRRRAIFLLGRRADSASAELLTEAARSEPDMSVRSEAILYLARMPGDRSIPVLEELVKSDDENVQRAAVQALATSESPRARLALRALVERGTASERVRGEALSSFEKDRSTADDAAWLRSLYTKVETQRLKARVLGAVARMGGAENDQWLLALAKKSDEPMELRAEALRRVAATAPVADVAKLYDATGERQLREQVMYALGRRKEAEATDKLLEIARSGTDPELRRSAISMLTRKNDPRTTKLLMEILDK